LHPFALALLAIVTVVAAIPACSFVYFELHPVHLPPWKSPEISLLAWLFLIGPVCMLLGYLAFRPKQKQADDVGLWEQERLDGPVTLLLQTLLT
jgi:hypothetical protein